MAVKHLAYAVEDGIAVLTLNNPDESVNVVTPAFVEDFDAAVRQAASDDGVSGIIVTSGKPLFMAGADLKILGVAFTRGMTMKEAIDFAVGPSDMHRRLETCGKPSVAALNGFALGGGYELALACHRRIVVDSPKAVIGLPEVNLGLLPGSGGIQRLGRLVGTQKALHVLLTGKKFTPQEALELGLVDEVVSAEALMDAARAWLKSSPVAVKPWDEKGYVAPQGGGLLDVKTAGIHTMQTAASAGKTWHNYPAPIVIQQCLFEGLQQPFDRAQRLENKYFAKLLTGPVARNIIRTTFLTKGENDSLVMRPQGVPPCSVRKLGVLGAGMMGSGIAYAAAATGIDVTLIDTSQDAADKGKAYSAKLLDRMVAKGARTREQADEVLSRIVPTTGYGGLADADLVIEAVFEDSGVKKTVTEEAAAVMPATAPFASNTSTLPISKLALVFARPEDFIGLHFFSPVDRMALVEVITGQKTSQETLARALDFVRQIRKTPIVVNDSRGFYTSRVFQTFIHEGMALLQEGVRPALIENAARQAGMPVGPLQVTDEVTLELPLRICDQAIREEGNNYTVPVSYPVMKKMIDECGRPGRKAGAGFYEYADDGTRRLWPGLADAFPVANRQPGVEDVKRRLLYIQSLETVRCLEDGVITRVEDGDLGSVLGWGFPTWTGGTLSLIETVGVATFVAECDRLADACGERFRPTQQLRERAAGGRRMYA